MNIYHICVIRSHPFVEELVGEEVFGESKGEDRSQDVNIYVYVFQWTFFIEVVVFLPSKNINVIFY